MKPEKAVVSLDRLLVTYSTWLVLIQRLRQDSLCLILSSVPRHRSRAGRLGQRDVVALPGPLTRLASDHSEQRQWSAPHRSSARQRLNLSSRYYPRWAASAFTAKSCRIVKNSGGWPMNSPPAVQALTVATAPPLPPGSVGRIIETTGNLRLRKTVGSGMIRLVWKSSPPKGEALRFGNTNPLMGSVSAGALPALSCQV